MTLTTFWMVKLHNDAPNAGDNVTWLEAMVILEIVTEMPGRVGSHAFLNAIDVMVVESY